MSTQSKELTYNSRMVQCVIMQDCVCMLCVCVCVCLFVGVVGRVCGCECRWELYGGVYRVQL